MDPDPDWIRIRIGLQPQTPDPDQMNTDPKPCHRALIYIMESTQFLKRMCYEIYWVYINVRMDISSPIRRAPQLFKLFYRCSSFFEFLRYFVQARRWKRESPAKGIHLQEFRGGDSEHGLQYRLSNCWLRHFSGSYYTFIKKKLAFCRFLSMTS